MQPSLRAALFRISGLKQAAHCGYAIRRNSSALGMFADHRFVRREVDAVDLVAGHVAVQPLNVVPQAANRSHRPLRYFTELSVAEITDTGNVAFDYEFRHGECRPGRRVNEAI